jgi:hypothetical protein
MKAFYAIVLILSGIFLSSCKKDTTLSDAEKLAALKNVAFSFSGVSFEVGLPANALSGQTFQELMAVDSATYANPANYSVKFLVKMLADNTKENAEDSKFDGMVMNMIMDTIQASPIKTTAGAFELLKNTSQEVVAQGTINLATHKAAGLYIFQQIADGQDLATKITTLLNYKVGELQGAINLPEIQEQIPTSGSPEMKSFLTGMINSGVFN